MAEGGSMTIPIGIVSINDRQAELVNRSLRNHRLSYGPMTRRLEERLAEIHGVRHAVFMASGTCALQVALEAAKERHGWTDGSEVIIPATTFIATMSAVLHAGLTPVLCDVEWDRFGLAPGQIDQHKTKRTVAVLPVHLLGRAALMDLICAEAERLGLKVIEDCCEAVGVEFNGQPVGSFGIAGAMSSYVCHHFSTGVGGAVLASDDKLATTCRSLMQHGRSPDYLKIEDDDGLDDAAIASMMRARYSFERWGHSYRATELEAALGVGLIDEEKSENIIAAERSLAFLRIRDALASFSEWIQQPGFTRDDSPLFYPLLCRNEMTCAGLGEAFEKAGIETRPLMPLLTQKIVLDYLAKQGKSPADFPVAADLCRRAFIIGCHLDIGPAEADLIRRTAEVYFTENRIVSRAYTSNIDKELWSEAWRAESCAEGQFKLASGEVKQWLAGEPHPAFDAFTELLSHTEDVGSLLEIGCGAGYYQRLVPDSMTFTGIDISEAMIRIANREYQPGTFLVASAEALPFADAAFDCSVLGSVIGCCDDWKAAVREAFRVSKRYVLLHRAAVHDFAGAEDVRNTVKVAYGVRMAERIIRLDTVLDELRIDGEPLGEGIRWSNSADGFQASYLFEVR